MRRVHACLMRLVRRGLARRASRGRYAVDAELVAEVLSGASVLSRAEHSGTGALGYPGPRTTVGTRYLEDRGAVVIRCTVRGDSVEWRPPRRSATAGPLEVRREYAKRVLPRALLVLLRAVRVEPGFRSLAKLRERELGELRELVRELARALRSV